MIFKRLFGVLKQYRGAMKYLKNGQSVKIQKSKNNAPRKKITIFWILNFYNCLKIMMRVE
jgi:hypothetical protein